MAFLAGIAEQSIVAFGALLLVAQLVAHRIGVFMGRREKARATTQMEGVGVVVGGMLALMAFVLALTLSFANTRFSERRTGTLAEANAIGTAWLRAKAVGTPRAEAIATLLEQYTKVRADFVTAGLDTARINALNQKTSALQSTIWGHVAAIVREQPNPVSASLMAAINDTFDMSTAERLAMETRLPPQLFWLLILMTLLSTASVGYQLGLRGRSKPLLVVLLMFMWTVVIVDILDLAAPRLGNFRTSAAPYEWTIQGFSGGVVIPPAP
ncbi:hypothetical protein K9U40_02760 [Xanthobacter autotrophicus]|uniref:bestrophin-like domain n=1 Tax=Xanthobacter TaxID=279 RepID=UPI0024ABF830|nr:hypothetical protein [Xanthobacter autotrophicus]MDI4663265.1 hypothetical protein [Xanthobacter autotrophicus]